MSFWEPNRSFSVDGERLGTFFFLKSRHLGTVGHGGGTHSQGFPQAPRCDKPHPQQGCLEFGHPALIPNGDASHSPGLSQSRRAGACSRATQWRVPGVWTYRASLETPTGFLNPTVSTKNDFSLFLRLHGPLSRMITEGVLKVLS